MNFLIILLIVSLILLILSAAYGIINYVIYNKDFYRNKDFIVITDINNKIYYINKDDVIDFQFDESVDKKYTLYINTFHMICYKIQVYDSTLYKFIEDVQK